MVTEYDTDKYGRTVGVVRVEGVNVNESLIQAGLAWQYRKYCKASFCNDWLELESRAKKSKVGLWKDIDPIPPWQWRKGARNSSYNKGVVGGGYHGNVKSHVFHSSRCRHYNCKNCIKEFSTKTAAVRSGYRPSGGCKP